MGKGTHPKQENLKMSVSVSSVRGQATVIAAKIRSGEYTSSEVVKQFIDQVWNCRGSERLGRSEHSVADVVVGPRGVP